MLQRRQVISGLYLKLDEGNGLPAESVKTKSILADISELSAETERFGLMPGHQLTPDQRIYSIAGRNGPVKGPLVLTRAARLISPPRMASRLSTRMASGPSTTPFPSLPSHSCAYHLRSRLHETAFTITRSPSGRLWAGSKPADPCQDRREQRPGHRHLGHLKRQALGMRHHFCSDLDQLLPQRR
jgi:hypothetical protein